MALPLSPLWMGSTSAATPMESGGLVFTGLGQRQRPSLSWRPFLTAFLGPAAQHVGVHARLQRPEAAPVLDVPGCLQAATGLASHCLQQVGCPRCAQHRER